MRTYLVVTAETYAPAGLVGLAILDAGDYYDTIIPGAQYASWSPDGYPGIPTGPGDYAGLIIMGGAMSANDVEDHPYLLELEALSRSFEAEGRAVLGVCLGAQIVARAWGGEVFSMGKLETGYVDVEVAPESETDPVFAAVDRNFAAFQNHYEVVRNVPGLACLVTGGACDIQAFRIGERVYGTQFHIEVTPDIAREFYRLGGETLYRDAPYMKQDLDAGFRKHFKQHNRVSRLIVDGWLRLARGD